MTISDATTLIALARVGRLELLRQVATQIVIPKAVYEEVVIRGAGKPGAEEVETADWIEVHVVTDRRQVEEF